MVNKFANCIGGYVTLLILSGQNNSLKNVYFADEFDYAASSLPAE
jgi:hypothetical protein